MNGVRSMISVVLLLVVCGGAACKTPRPSEALELGSESLAQRQLETRRFDTADELIVLRACLMILQDGGFQLDEMESDLGVLAATKSGRPETAVSLVSRPVGQQQRAVAVRVTFQQLHRATAAGGGRVTTPAEYHEFFRRLSADLSLEAHTQ